MVGGEINRKVVDVLTKEYDLTKAGVTFKNIAPADARRAIETKEVNAILIVISAYREISDAGAQPVSAERQGEAGADSDRIRRRHRADGTRL